MGIDKSGVMLTGTSAFASHYSSWTAANGLGAKLSAFIEGSANMIAALGISRHLAVTIMGVFIVSFAATTLDTATRIQRYVVAEMAEESGISWMTGRIPATVIAVGTAMALAFYSGNGKGAMTLWPIFGAVNQLLASLALLSVTAYLVHTNRPVRITLPVMLFMIGITSWAMAANTNVLLQQNNLFLAGISILILVLQAWMLVESWIILKGRFGNSVSDETELVPELVTVQDYPSQGDEISSRR